MTNARLNIENRDSYMAWFGQARFSKEANRERICLRVVGTYQVEKGRLARTYNSSVNILSCSYHNDTSLPLGPKTPHLSPRRTVHHKPSLFEPFTSCCQSPSTCRSPYLICTPSISTNG